MTVIAWDGKTLAADRQSSYGGMICAVTKIHRVGDLLVGGSGDLAFVLEMIEWVRGGRVISEFPAAQRTKDDWQSILVVERDGTTSIYERTAFPIRYEEKAVVIGSGREFARAALHLGFDSVKAVETAIALSDGCGVGIDTLVLA